MPTFRRNLIDPGLFLRWNFLIWLVLGVFGMVVRYSIHEEFGRAAVLTVMQEPVGFVLTSLMWLIYRNPRWLKPFTVLTALWVVLLSLLAATGQSGATLHFIHEVGWQHPEWSQREEWMFRIIFFWLLYMLWGLAWFGCQAHYRADQQEQRADQAEREKERMELRLLRSQLDPHFLFNSLNGVAVQTSTDPESAREMIYELSDYLRYSLEHRNQLITTLESELGAMQAYLHIEKARFGERVQTEIDADPSARRAMVPAFLLQPLVENAVRYGFIPEEECWELKIEAVRPNEGELTVAVWNRGSLQQTKAHGTGVGLATLRRRLEIHYPGRHQFDLEQVENRVVARLQLKGEP